MENQDKKRDRIVDVAQKRFAHYGLSKTTMNEIADDLSMSKALLYYYFPDKNSLYFAVLEKLFNEHFDEMQEEVQKTDSSAESLTIYLHKRHDFIKKYFILLEFNKSFSENFAQMKSRFSEIRVKEQAFLTRILTEGAKSGEFKIKDPKKIEELIFDSLIGIRLVVLENYSNTLQPDDTQFNMILEKQQLLTELIIKGLKG